MFIIIKKNHSLEKNVIIVYKIHYLEFIKKDVKGVMAQLVERYLLLLLLLLLLKRRMVIVAEVVVVFNPGVVNANIDSLCFEVEKWKFG